jgi:hypothetical protein
MEAPIVEGRFALEIPRRFENRVGRATPSLLDFVDQVD